MPNSTPPTLTELEKCRERIVFYISEAEKLAAFASKELVTLRSALEHIEQLIKDARTVDPKNSRASRSERKKPAA